MPYPGENFTSPYIPGTYTPPAPPTKGAGDHGEVWNPSGGPDGQGAWEQPTQSSSNYQFKQGAWGDKGNDIDGNGNEVAGTSGAAEDASRYRDMAAAPTYTTGPQMDQSQSGESRGLSMGALGLLGQTAAGTQPSAAEQLGTQMGQNAQNAGYSLGASVRGGAMARAAASRNATMNAGVIDAQTRQSNAATRAGEMAGARDAYFGAATGQRGEDLSAATTQAGLNEGQNSANDSREGFYEDLGQKTKNAELSHELGRTESDEAASAANSAQSLASQAAANARTDKQVSTIVGGATGGANAYAKTQSPDPAPATPPSQGAPAPAPAPSGGGGGDIDRTDPYANPDPNTDSDERMKQDVMPLYEPPGTELRMSDQGRGFLASKQPDVTSGASLSGPTPKYSTPTAAPAAKAKSVAAPTRKMTDAELDKRAADMQAQLEAQRTMLKGGPSVTGEHPQSAEPATPKARVKDRASKMSAAPNPYDAHDTSVYARSNDKDTQVDTDALHKGIEAQIAKDQATDIDRNNPYTAKAMFGARMGEPADAGYAASRKGQPGYMFGGAPQASYGALFDHHPDEAPGTDDVYHGFKAPLKGYDRDISMSDENTKKGVADFFGASHSGESTRAHNHFSGEEQKEIAPDEGSKVREDRKFKAGNETPMANSNRSMAPHSYSYKDEFLPPEQARGETNVGPMANAMAADPVAKTAIIKDPKSGLLAIDKTKGLKLVMGGLADLQRQVDQMGARR